MELIDRYLQAVRGCLPKAQREDIIRELSDDLRSQVEDREEALGRPLTAEEEAAILRQFGHPMLLASRYRPKQQLIGAAIFPFYWFVLKISLLGMLLVHVIASIVMLAIGKPAAEVVANLVTLPVGPGVMVFGWVTLVFAIADRHVTRLPFIVDWKPESLPPLRKEPAGRSRAALVCEIFMSTLFLLWWAALPNNTWLVFGPAWKMLELSPVFDRIHLPILFLSLAGLVVQWINLIRRDWLGHRDVAKVVSGLVALVTVAILLNSGDLVAADATSLELAKMVRIVNMSVRVSLIVMGIVVTIDIVRDAIRLARSQDDAVTSKA
jgi:hypothetical protein